MADNALSKRIDIRNLDKTAIKDITNDVAKMLTEISQMDLGDPNAKFHLKLGHIKIQYIKSHHSEIIIGKPDDTDGDTPSGD